MSVPAGALDQAASQLAAVVADLADGLGGAPTLAELLELLGWALPINSEATDGTFTEPLRFKAVLTGNKPYRSDAASRVSDLNDHVFEDARDVHSVLVERMRAAGDAPVTLEQFVSAILQVLRSARLILADVKPDDIHQLTADLSKKVVAKPRPGAVLAIPARSGGYHMAVVLAHTRFGMALGLFRGTSAQARLDAGLRRAPWKHAVYTDQALVADGTWTIVGHDESLLTLFPSDPPIYHQPNAWLGIVDTGQFGAAESPDGTLRLIGQDEAREVGLHDGAYQQGLLPAYLQKLLDQKAES